MDKQYGLIKPEKNKVIIRPAIFNESSDSDDSSDKPTGIQALKKKDRLVQDKILAEDPTVYQYDELYDEMQTQRTNSKLARKDLEKKPKYINKLLETADRRKRENERRIERQVQKEREEEGDMYKDKESFVTSAYRKKLEEMKELEEKEKREEYLEAIGDVKKQSDLSGFYRHLYAQQVNFEEEMEKQQKFKDKEKEHEKQKSDEEKPKSDRKEKRQRKYRKRENSKSSEDEEAADTKLEHLPSNLDADSDFSIDSESDSEPDVKKTKAEPKIKQENVSGDEKSRQSPEPKKEAEAPDKAVKVEVKTEQEDNEQPPVTEDPEKPKKDIWKKRTVGVVFEEALKRYYERKAAREIAL